MKIFDAIEGVEGVKPRLILVSALDVRDPEKIPSHYVSFFPHFIGYLSSLLFSKTNHRMKTISHTPIDYEKSSQHTCTGSMKQTRIL